MAKHKKNKETSLKEKRPWWARFLLKGTALFFRTLLFTIMLLMLLGAGLWVFVINMFNAQRLSEQLTQYLQRQLGRPVVVASLNLKFLNTVELHGFAVLDDRVQPGDPLLSAESVSIRYKLLPLLEHRLEIEEVTLNKPRINILRAENGETNVPKLKSDPAQSSFISERTGQRIEVSIEDWNIKEGVLSYKDLGAGVSHAVYGLNAHFYHLRLDKLSRFRLHTVLRNRWGGNISDLEIRGTGQINLADFDWTRFALRNFKTQVYAFKKPVSLTVDLDNLRTPFFTVRAKVPAFDNQDLSVFYKDLPLFNVPAATVTARGALGKGYTKLKLDEVAVSSDNLVASSSGMLDFSAQPFSADLQMHTEWNNLAVLSNRWPALEKFKLSGEGKIVSAQIKRVNGKYEMPLIEFAAKNAKGSFWGFEADSVSGILRAKKNWTDLYAQLTDGHVQVAKSSFDKLKLTASYRGGDVYGYISSGLLNKVPLKLRLSIDNIKSKKRKINTSLYLKHFEPMPFIDVVFDFAEVISNIGGKPSASAPVQTGDLAWMRNFRDRLPQFMPNFSGTLYADTFSSTVLSGNRFNAEFDFTGLLPGGKDLNGTLDLKLEEGIIHQMEKLAEEQQVLNVTFTPFIMLHRMERSGSFKVGEVLKDVAVDEMAASVDFKNGTMIINNAFTQGPVISAAVSGWVDWVRETFELVIWTMFTPRSKRGILAENLTDESGNPALAFKVSSSMLKPRLEMLRAKKTNEQIQSARKRGLRTNFKKSRDFVKGEFNAKK